MRILKKIKAIEPMAHSSLECTTESITKEKLTTL